MAAPRGSGEIDVLVAEDDDESRQALEEILPLLGYRCRSTRDGREAWEEQQRAPAAIVLTDWTMPEMTGIELCRRIKDAQQGSYIVLMTGFDERTRLIEGMRAGADDFLRKPIDWDELEVRLLAAARLVRAQRDLAHVNRALRHETERESRSARTDRLTGLGNRVRLDEDLARVVHDRERYGRRCSAALCDVDWFKLYNDEHGHLAGDDALRRVAGVLRDALREGDTAYRYGGEEFLVLLPEQTREHAALAMERVRAGVEALQIPHPRSAHRVVTISVGIAELGRASVDDWLARADAALYRAKSRGRNRVAEGDAPEHASSAPAE